MYTYLTPAHVCDSCHKRSKQTRENIVRVLNSNSICPESKTKTFFTEKLVSQARFFFPDHMLTPDTLYPHVNSQLTLFLKKGWGWVGWGVNSSKRNRNTNSRSKKHGEFPPEYPLNFEDNTGGILSGLFILDSKRFRCGKYITILEGVKKVRDSAALISEYQLCLRWSQNGGKSLKVTF